MAPSWPQVGPKAAQVGPSWPKWPEPAKLGPQAGPKLAQAGRSWTQVGAKLAPSWPILGRSWPLLARSGCLLGLSWGLLGRSWQRRADVHENPNPTCVLRVRFGLPGAQVGPSWSKLAQSWVEVGPKMPPRRPKTRQKRRDPQRESTGNPPGSHQGAAEEHTFGSKAPRDTLNQLRSRKNQEQGHGTMDDDKI